MAEVTGSSPVSPTILLRPLHGGFDGMGFVEIGEAEHDL